MKTFISTNNTCLSYFHGHFLIWSLLFVKTGTFVLHRSFSVSSNWNIFTNHLKHTLQLLSNNNFSMKLIDDTINKFINNKLNTLENTTQISNDIKLYLKIWFNAEINFIRTKKSTIKGVLDSEKRNFKMRQLL